MLYRPYSSGIQHFNYGDSLICRVEDLYWISSIKFVARSVFAKLKSGRSWFKQSYVSAARSVVSILLTGAIICV